MKDRIKFSDEMLAAVIDGRKTQTRRLIEPQPNVTEKRLRELDAWQDGYTLSEQVCEAWRHGFIDDDCPYGQVGDTIPFADKDGNIKGEIEIVDVWLQRVQEISQEDTLAEGFSGDGISGSAAAYAQFADIWISIYGAESWSENPWVWVIEFKQIQEG
ncbi:TPA: ASCH domain-containing protein [Morganella morganii]|nr:ASCH domain-containing protein [Morganella morganii]